MKEPEIPLNKLLKQIVANRKSTRCFVCSEPLIAAEVKKFHDLRKSGDPQAKQVSWTAFWKLHLRGQMDWRGTYSALMGHVRSHLGGDGSDG